MKKLFSFAVLFLFLSAGVVQALDGLAVLSVNERYLMHREWLENTFGALGLAIDMGAPAEMQFVAYAADPVRNESIAMFKYWTYIMAKRWKDDAWQLPGVTLTGTSPRGTRNFDIAFESESGDGLLVYERNGTLDTEVDYRIWDGSSWRGPFQLTLAPSTAVFQWIQLVPHPTQDWIALAASDSNGNLNVNIWNGTNWLGSQTLTSSLSTTATESFSIAWEAIADRVMVLYGTQQTTAFSLFDTATETWSAPSFTSFNPEAAVNYVELCGSAATNSIGMILLTAGTATAAQVWDGSQWLGGYPLPDPTSSTPTTRISDCAFEGAGNRILFTYVDASATTPTTFDYFLYDADKSSWLCEGTPVVSIADNACTLPPSMEWSTTVMRGELTSHPGGNETMLLGSDAGGSLRGILWNNSQFNLPETWILSTTTLSSIDKEPSQFDWQRYHGQVISVSLLTDTMNFGQIQTNQSLDTLGDNPPPFVLRNDGNVNVSIAIQATDLWTDEPNPSPYYTFLCNATTEASCRPGDPVTFTNMPDTNTVHVLVSNLGFKQDEDEIEAEINITAPPTEEAGQKQSLVTFVVSPV